MKREPTAMAAKAATAWAPDLPDWVEELARLADLRGLKGAEKAIGYSASTLSQVISNSYPGDTARVAEKVRGALMGVTVDCPVLGDIGRDRCLNHQKAPRAATNSTRMRLYRACRGGCPHARLQGDASC